MAIPRLAGALIKKLALPQSAGEWALEVGPEVLFAGFAGASLPEGTPLQDRLLIAAEDLTLGLGGSIGGRVAGAGLGQGFSSGARRGLNSEGLKQAMSMGAMAGGMAGGMGVPMLAPRPFAAHLQAKAEQQMAAEQAARDQGIFEQGLMASAQYMADSPRVQGIDGVLAQLYGA